MQSKMILIVSKDAKTELWSASAIKMKLGNLVQLKGSPIYLPLMIVYHRLIIGRFHAVCFRYLNDYPSIMKTIIRTISEIIAVYLCRIFRVKVLWICHNVDRESAEFYPRLTLFRRKLLLRHADVVFFTAEELKKLGTKMLPYLPRKASVVSFGGPPIITSVDRKNCNDFKFRVNDWLKRQKNADRMIGLWIGDVSPKKVAGLESIVSICTSETRMCGGVSMILIGRNFNSLAREQPEIVQKIKNAENIFLDDSGFDFHPDCWPEFVDFVIKPFYDLSIPLTVSYSVYARLPFLAFSNTFLGDFVEKSNIGVAVPTNVSGLEIVERLNDSSFDFEEFEGLVNWDLGAESLFESI